MNISYHPKAKAELNDAIDYYEQIEEWLGFRFFSEIEEALSRIEDFPNSYPFVEEAARKCNVRRFPYAIIFSVLEDDLYVHAIAHQNMRPGYWKDRE
ncbi:MAG: type II toxin-antitoxin system RelE/ParE family toxin [Planctomycetes bacterium]|nr:type II toxin-antitoxin system RelE/ParE family toxin [Planctomycetota bacterium]